MRCKTCDYPLWNLTTRQCPECGSAFRPADFEFVQGSTRFCCPGCGQAYYGTDAKGHLEPRAFDCVTCGRRIDMDEMILLPAEGVAEKHTSVAVNPWLDRPRIGWWKGFFATIGQALVMPGRLMRGTAVESGSGTAFWFMLVTVFLTLAAAFAPWILIMGLMTGMAGPAGGRPANVGGMLLVLALTCASAIVLLLAVAGAWMLVTHFLLRLTGGLTWPLGRTCQAICYSSGAFVATAIPCMGQYIAVPWWMVSAVLAVKDAHKVGGGRAAFCVLAFPVGLIALFVGGYFLLIVLMMRSAGGWSATAAVAPQAQRVLDAVIAHAGTHGGQGPAHGLLLVASGDLSVWDVVDGTSATGPGDVPAGAGNLNEFTPIQQEGQAEAAAAEAARLPPDTIAHRVGDYVFTHHGIDLTMADPGLWLVVASPDPDANPGYIPPFTAVGRADGTVQSIPMRDFSTALTVQNALRQLYDLPPLPDPAGVTHRSPAVAGK